MDTVETLIEYCKSNGRICPQPQRWNELFQLLPNTRQVGAGFVPGAPLILAAWWDTPHLSKQLRLIEHIQWAEKHCALERVAQFLRSLPEKDWFHINE